MTRFSRRKNTRTGLALGASLLLIGVFVPAATSADDPRVGLAPGYLPWTEVASNIDHIDNDPRVPPFDAPPGNFGFVNSDLAFIGDNAIVGGFNGFQVYSLADPANPVLRSSFVCPGGQGDPSVFGNLLFISVEETRGRIDCGTQGAGGAVNLERFRGVRIFDISDIDNPVQLPAYRPAGARTPTRSSPTPTTPTTSTSTTPVRRRFGPPQSSPAARTPL